MDLAEIVAAIDEIAPPELAEAGDPIGRQMGPADADVERVLVALDVTPDVAREAVELGADLMISHHPLIYRPLDSLDPAAPLGRSLALMLEEGIALYVAHTNLDAAVGCGVNAVLAELLGLAGARPIEPARLERRKIVVFVPEDDLEAVRTAMAAAGAGSIGNYRECSFRAAGAGSFRPVAGAGPAIGEVGSYKETPEWRLEMVALPADVDAIVRAMKSAHSYDEAAYDVYPLEATSGAAGMGRYGTLSAETTVAGMAELVAERLGVAPARIVGSRERRVSNVAVCGGAGSSLIPKVAAMGMDLYVTGDVTYHAAQEAAARGLAVIDAGHRETELPVVERLAGVLDERLGAVEVLTSEVDANPYIVD
jgi:dinuclear metal center YbgI/SA1388 family protein